MSAELISYYLEDVEARIEERLPLATRVSALAAWARLVEVRLAAVEEALSPDGRASLSPDQVGRLDRLETALQWAEAMRATAAAVIARIHAGEAVAPESVMWPEWVSESSSNGPASE